MMTRQIGSVRFGGEARRLAADLSVIGRRYVGRQCDHDPANRSGERDRDDLQMGCAVGSQECRVVDRTSPGSRRPAAS